MTHRVTSGFTLAVVTSFILNQPIPTWGQFQNLGGVIAGNPTCASPNDGTGQVICGVKGTNNALFGIRFDPRTNFTTGYQSLGGVVVGDPTCANAGQVR